MGWEAGYWETCFAARKACLAEMAAALDSYFHAVMMSTSSPEMGAATGAVSCTLAEILLGHHLAILEALEKEEKLCGR